MDEQENLAEVESMKLITFRNAPVTEWAHEYVEQYEIQWM